MSYGLGRHIALPTGRRLIIPDVHGCAQTLRALLGQLRLSHEDQLFFLGDYINKGPDSLGVITCLEALIESGYTILPLLGNHDKMLLDGLEQRDQALESQLNGPDFLNGQLGAFDRHLPFFKSLAFFYISGDFLLVHAGFDFDDDAPFSNLNAMLTIRDYRYDKNKAMAKRIVHGHNPTNLDEIRTAIAKRAYLLPLDNGCVYHNRADQGNLICLNLDTFNLWVQPNIDSQ